MNTPHIALFDASVGETPAERNVRRELDARVTAFKTSESEFPEWPGADGSWAYDGVVISGSQTAVYEHEPGMETLADIGQVRVAVGQRALDCVESVGQVLGHRRGWSRHHT